MNTLDIFNTPEATAPFDTIKRTRDDGTEYWSARQLMPLLGYGGDWRNFTAAIDRAKLTATNQGMDTSDQFVDATELVKRPQGGTQPRHNVTLSRYAAYLVAMNGDPRKPEIAAAQSYFAIRTRQAETPAPALTGPALMAAALLEAAKTIEDTQAALETTTRELEAATPKAQSFDVFMGAAGDYSVNEAAKALSRDPQVATVGERRLFTLLEQWRMVYRDAKRRPRAYQVHVDAGRLVERAGAPYLDQHTGEWKHSTPQVRITAKGLDYLRHRLATPTIEKAA